MRIRVVFGESNQAEEIAWHKDIQDFPKLIEYKDENYSWAMYDKSEDVYVDYVFYYSKIPQYDRDFFTKAMTMNEIRDYWRNNDCECGAEKVAGSAKTGHSFWCPKWKKM